MLENRLEINPEEKIPPEKFQELLQLAKQNNLAAQLKVAYCYKMGKGASQDPRNALKYYRLAAQTRNAEAQYQLAYFYHSYPHKDHSINEDYMNNAVDWYTLAAKQGHVKAQDEIDKLLKKAQKYEIDMRTYVEYLEEDSSNDSLSSAKYYYSLLANAEHGAGHFGLAQCYWYEGYEYSLLAEEHVIKAANLGHVGARLLLGVWAEKRGDFKEAVDHYKAIIDQDKEAAFHLGQCYQNGKGVKKDFAQAIRLYRSAIEKGYTAAEAALEKCFHKIGYAKIAKRFESAEDDLLPQDQKMALKYYQKGAAEDESPENRAEAQYRLGLRHENGLDGISKDIENAIYLYKLAAGQNHVEAAFRAAKLLETGEPKVKDEKEAFRYYQLAAKQKHTAAQFELGRCFENAIGIQQNYAKAKAWYELVPTSDSNHEKAQEALVRVNKIICTETETRQKSWWVRFFGTADPRPKGIELHPYIYKEGPKKEF